MLDDSVLNKLKLARMYESLLRASNDNKLENLDKYRGIVVEIDKCVVSSFLELLNSFDSHNQTLEEELRFLIEVKDNFNWIFELQANFRNVCRFHGYMDIELYDLSQVDIEYINRRIEVIKTYLENLTNIDSGEKRLRELSNELVIEEKKKSIFGKKLLEYEDLLVANFENAEGRIIVDGQLQYVSVVTEYKKLGFDFKLLINDPDKLKELLDQANRDNADMEEKRRTAELCYNAYPNINSKQIFDDISRDFFRIRYKLIILKILDLLTKKYDEYDLFKDKREKILDLIKYRVICLKNLGEHISIDPFARAKVSEQIEILSSLDDNSKKISIIRKEILLLNASIDEMVNQNEELKIEISERKPLVIDRVDMNDIIDSSIEVSEELGTILLSSQNYLDNQVISIGDVSLDFPMKKAIEKTGNVLNRVNSMLNAPVVESLSNLSSKPFEPSVVAPELVIGSPVVTVDEEVVDIKSEEVVSSNSVLDFSFDFMENIENEFPTFDVSNSVVPEDDVTIEKENNSELDVVEGSSGEIIPFEYDDLMFETVDPFLQTPLYSDRTGEDSLKDEDSNQVIDFSLMDEEDDTFDLEEKEKDLLGEDDFWVTSKDVTSESDTKEVPLDEQIAALIEDDVKTKKLAA